MGMRKKTEQKKKEANERYEYVHGCIRCAMQIVDAMVRYLMVSLLFVAWSHESNVYVC